MIQGRSFILARWAALTQRPFWRWGTSKWTTLDALFRRAKAKAGLPDIHFHDSRHTAAPRIGRAVGQPGRLSFPEFCKVFGWRDPKHALIYVNPTAEELADKL